MKKSFAFIVPLLVMGVALLCMALLPFASLKALLGHFVSDGNFKTLTAQNVQVFHSLFAALGILFSAGGLAFFLRPAWLDAAALLWRALLVDARALPGRLRFEGERNFIDWPLWLLILSGLILRVAMLMRPMLHDEAYTYFAFASGSLHTALSDYHLPNNHVFHTLLVFLSTRILGNAPWAVRLPACLAGILIIPAAYALARRFYDRDIALFTAALIAIVPDFVHYSTNARGYTLVALFTLCLLILADVLRLQQNRVAWILLALITALGFFTVPVMMFPFGTVFIWLALSAWFEPSDSYGSRYAFWRWWIFAGLLAAALTLLFYLPVLVYAGPDKLFQNDWVNALPAGTYLETVQVRFQEIWREWTRPLSGLSTLIPLMLLILSFIFQRKLARPRVAVQWAAILWIVIVLIARRPNPWPKVMFFLAPLAAMWMTAGLFGLIRLTRVSRVTQNIERYVLLATLVGVLAYTAVLTPSLPGQWQSKGDAEQAVLYLQPLIQPNDVLIVSPPDDAPMWYYSMWHQVPRFFFRPDVENHARLFVITSAGWDQTVTSVLKERGPEIDPPDPASAQFLQRFGKISLYLIP